MNYKEITISEFNTSNHMLEIITFLASSDYLEGDLEEFLQKHYNSQDRNKIVNACKVLKEML